MTSTTAPSALDDLRIIGPAVRFSDIPATSRDHTPAPRQHSAESSAASGHSSDDTSSLARRDVTVTTEQPEPYRKKHTQPGRDHRGMRVPCEPRKSATRSRHR